MGVEMGELSPQAHPTCVHQSSPFPADSWPYHSGEEMQNPGQRTVALAGAGPRD